MNDKLKPCPFCGGEPNQDREEIFCDCCGVKMPISAYSWGEMGKKYGYPTYEEALKQMREDWNRRVNDEQAT